MFCVKCGTNVKEDVTFCPKCGHPVSAVQTDSEQVAVPENQAPPAEPESASAEESAKGPQAVPFVCENCGTPLEEETKFCPKCGCPVSGTQPQQPATNVIVPTVLHKQPNEFPVMAQIVEEKTEKPKKKLSPEEIRFKKMKIGLIAAIAGGVFLIALSIGIGIWKYKETSGYLDYWFYRHNELAAKYPIIIKSLDVGNALENGNWITEPGGRLDAPAMRYLQSVMTYDSFGVNGQKITVEIKIYDSRNVLSRINNNTSYTYTRDVILSQDGGEVELGGWGNTDRSTYSRGDYRIEVWYQGVCLASKTISIY
jgi:hypothetical protein